MPKFCAVAPGPMPDSCRILWRRERAGGQDHFAAGGQAAILAVAPHDHRARPFVGQFQPRCVGLGEDRQVGTVQDRLEESLGRAHPPARALVDMEIADALVVAGVEIVGRVQAVVLGSGLEGIEDFPG
jgi:hypothetical protein